MTPEILDIDILHDANKGRKKISGSFELNSECGTLPRHLP